MGAGVAYDDTLPSGAVSCTQAQYQNPDAWAISSGAIVASTLTLAAAQAAQLAALNQACASAITAGFSATINGASATVTLSASDQANMTMNAATAQTALQAAAWASGATYAKNALVIVGGVPLVTFSGGVSGTAAPAAPTAFQSAVTDGAVTWYKLGFWLGTSTGNVMIAPADMIQVCGEMVAHISQCRSKYETFKAQVQAATTVADVQAIVWQ
ncbi:hypothetical protein SAMN02746095_02969 [Acidocella aminolytica 101 = DSM 11237]|nr:hypothetical protein SAMN02746095_02969 [Acidocella aminolytica 101 = DSM 11237]